MNILQFVPDRTFIKNSLPFGVVLSGGLQRTAQFKPSGGNDFNFPFHLQPGGAQRPTEGTESRI